MKQINTDPRDKNVSGKTNNIGISIISQISLARNITVSQVVHDAIISYGETQPEIPETLRREIFIIKNGSELALLSGLASKTDDFASIRVNFIAFCTNFSTKISGSEQKTKMVEDIKHVLGSIEIQYPVEFDKLSKVARKMLKKADYKLIFVIEDDYGGIRK